MSIPSLATAVGIGLLAAVGVAYQRAGLGLSLLLVALLAVAAWAPCRGPRVALVLLGVALALQALLRDAGWVVALTSCAALACAGAIAAAPLRWSALAGACVAPLRLVRGSGLAARAIGPVLARVGGDGWATALRAGALATALVVAFGALFVTADAAFADLVSNTFAVDVNPAQAIWRGLVGIAAAASACALVAARAPRPLGPQRLGWAPRATELRVALIALVALFALFVTVQVHVLFGGQAYVQRTTGLGLGEYARQGFTQMLVVAGLTLAVVGIAARRGDTVVRALLGLLCVLCLVVLVSAGHRLALVVDAYGLTRVRVAGQAAVPCLQGCCYW